MAQPQKHETVEQRSERIKLLQDQLRIDYGMLFTSEKGLRVLDDLKQRFGWKGNIERPSAHIGARPDDVFLTEGMKEVVRHILAMTEQVTTEQPKLETKALK